MAPTVRKKPRVTEIRPAGPDHQVVSVEGGRPLYRREPCATCPWRVDAVGEFPAEAFRHSASTAYDMAQRAFSCHESGTAKPALCAGFLLRGAEHNLTVRMHRMAGAVKNDVSDGGHQLHASYRAMAVANGVGEDEAVLQPCRED